MTNRTEEIKKELEDVEWYTPTVPMRWQKYHEIIRELCEIIEANQSEEIVSSDHTLPSLEEFLKEEFGEDASLFNVSQGESK